jgi:hypothetical protein
MSSNKTSQASGYVEKNIGGFHLRRLKRLNELKLYDVLKRKNPYLFKAKNILTSQDLVKTLLDAHLSSQEETIFGEFLEGLAIFICGKVFNGTKSSAEGIDLEFEKDSIKYIVSIKSGPNWGNSGQIKKMTDNFRKAKRILSANKSQSNIVAVNGCCYGKDDRPDKGDYLKLCGQRFWEFISGDQNLYIGIIEPLGHMAKEKNEEFMKEYSGIINKFSFEFTSGFCVDGKICWDKLVQFNSKSNNLKSNDRNNMKGKARNQ